MECFNSLSYSVKNLLYQLPMNCAEICKEISSEIHNSEILQGIIYFLVDSWTLVKRKNNIWNFSTIICLPTTCVLEAVEVFNGEKLFCQILFLLSEEQKFNAVKELCSLLKMFPNKYSILRKNFCEEASTCYIKNLLSISRPVVLSIGCDILNGILDSLFADIKSDNIQNLLWILSAILEKFDYFLEKNSFYLNKFNTSSASDLSSLNLYEREQVKKLNLYEREQVKKLKQFCCDLENLRFDNEMFCEKKIFENEDILLVLSNIVFRLSNAFENLQMQNIFETISEEHFVVILVKLKHVTQVLSENQDAGNIYKSFLSSSMHFFKVLSLMDLNNRTIKYVCVDASTSDLLQLRKQLKLADCRKMLSRCLELKDQKEKFFIAVHRLNHLYFGHKEVFDWLLQYEDLNTENAELWVKTLWTYTIRFCCFDVLKRYVEIVHDRFTKGLYNVLTKSFQELILKCIDHLSISTCNNLLFELIEHFCSGKSLLWPPCIATPITFERNLNEVLNKLTDSEEPNIQSFKNVAQLCLISPFVVLKEVVNRCLRKDLKVSILIKIVENMPTLLELYVVSDVTQFPAVTSTSIDVSDVTQLPAVIYFSHTFHVLLCEKYKSEKIMYQLLVGLINDSSSVKLLKSIVIWFIYPSLNGSVTSYNLNFSLELLEAFSVFKKIWNIGEILKVIKLLLSFVEKEATVDLVYKNLISMIGLLTYQYELCAIDDSVTVQLKTLAKTLKWFNSFYFYKLFKQYKVFHPFCVPQSVLAFSDINNQLYESVVDPLYNTDEGKWQGLIEIFVACQESGETFIEKIPTTSIDDEIQSIIEAVVNIFGKGICFYKAKLVVASLKKLIQKSKIEGVTSFVSEDLQNANETHDTCFSFLVMVQTYTSVFLKDTFDSVATAVLLKILHQFFVNAKEIRKSQVVIFLCLYFFEQLIYAVAMLSDKSMGHLELLLVELLRFILSCLKQLNDKTIASKVLLKCEETLSMINTNHVINEIFSSEKKLFI
ncbi:uncharacterized protein LOC105848666 isoform X1 [Hydra vulgaris]|uniref:uncharacterized protein LOC105848666 isoform X1 n=1 Tax=Hydra vulgaris TaxID=6087 RepID=UPI001F5F4443|nr:uncharacterized protein LOC105848666 isoform X1 [Hydra vulgaris]